MYALPARTTGRALRPALCLILFAYALARVLEIVPNGAPRLAIIALDVLSAMAFALVDGTRNFRLGGILVFTALCILVGNSIENLSIVTGFPFGHYHFLSLMGPKIFHVPILLGLAYIGMAYVSWVLGCIIVDSTHSATTGARLIYVPLVAGFIMVAWDLAQDPVWSTILHGWEWRDGGPWFGVPLSNYLGWYATDVTIYLLFALYLRVNAAFEDPPEALRGGAAICLYALCAAGNVAQALRQPDPAIVQDPTGHPWPAFDILGASALVSIFVMGAFALLAWIRLRGREAAIPTD